MRVANIPNTQNNKYNSSFKANLIPIKLEARKLSNDTVSSLIEAVESSLPYPGKIFMQTYQYKSKFNLCNELWLIYQDAKGDFVFDDIFCHYEKLPNKKVAKDKLKVKQQLEVNCQTFNDFTNDRISDFCNKIINFYEDQKLKLVKNFQQASKSSAENIKPKEHQLVYLHSQSGIN